MNKREKKYIMLCKFGMSNISIICVTICVIFLAISSMALKIFPVDSSPANYMVPSKVSDCHKNAVNCNTL